jgi:tripartite-type tricarboxylate transporter receptor subunit TctC
MAAIGRFAAAGLACAALYAHSAENYPSKTIRLVVISAPGGTTDVLARVIAQNLSESLGQPVITDNRPGGGGIIASEITARANPDGYTLLYAHTVYSVLPSLYRKLSYDPVKDFAPIGLVALFPNVLIVNNAVPARSVKELIALARSQPGKLNYAAGTTGGVAHLSGEMFKSMAGVDIIHVPYKGTGALLVAVIGGESQLSFATLPASMPHVRAGRVRALAISADRRSPVLPDLPTVSESGLPGFDVSAWNGVLAPRGTPRSVVEQLNRELRRIVALPAATERARAEGAEIITQGTPEQFAAYIQSQIAKWAKVVKFADIRPD